jgi:quercetin dioxygenase-like cupin family protein
MEYDGQTGTMRPGDYIEIMPGKYHRFTSLADFSRIIEASTPHEDADVFRKEPSRRLQ